MTTPRSKFTPCDECGTLLVCTEHADLWLCFLCLGNDGVLVGRVIELESVVGEVDLPPSGGSNRILPLQF